MMFHNKIVFAIVYQDTSAESELQNIASFIYFSKVINVVAQFEKTVGFANMRFSLRIS